MKKILFIFGFIFVLTGMCGATEFPIDISGSQYEPKNADTLRIRNVTFPGYEGLYWIDFLWNPSLLVFVPINAGVEEDLTQSQALNMLLGKWTFSSKLGASEQPFVRDFTLTKIEGGAAVGVDENGMLARAFYSMEDKYWALTNYIGNGVAYYYVFFTDGNIILPNSCKYTVTSGHYSICSILTGNKMAN